MQQLKPERDVELLHDVDRRLAAVGRSGRRIGIRHYAIHRIHSERATLDDDASIEALFVAALKLAREMGVLKLGTAALDGTKIHANASRHSALSYEHAGKIEAQLKAELLAKRK